MTEVLFAGAWDEGPGYPRAASLRQALAAAGAQVRECRVHGPGASKRLVLARPWRLPLALWSDRARRRTLRRALAATLATTRPEVVVVPYPGHTAVHIVRRAFAGPVVLDLFLSAYDTIVEDRRLAAPGSLIAHWSQRLDTRACASADLVLLDTPANAAYVASLTGLPAERFAWLPVGDPDAPAAPRPWPPPGQGPLRVLFFGNGVPLHGLTTLVDAIAGAPNTALTLVGGTEADRRRARDRLGLRLDLRPRFIDRGELQQLLDDHSLVAGVFGAGGKAQRVVPFKVVHALASGRPVVTADTPAIRGWLDGCGAVRLVPAADAPALAAELRHLAAAPGELRAAAARARAAYDRHFAPDQLAARWRELQLRLGAGVATGAA